MGHPGTPALVVTGHTAGLGVVRGLGAAGIPVTVLRHDPHEFAHASRFATDSIQVPHPEHAEEEFVASLLELPGRYDRALLIPTSDEAVSAVARHKATLASRFVVACTDWSVAEKFIDKVHTYELAERLGVPAPRTLSPRSLEDVEAADGVMPYPCLVKPRQSHLYYEVFGRKMVTVHDHGQMIEAYRDAAAHGLEVLIQELIPGDDTAGVNFNAYVVDGEPVVHCTAQKLRLSPPGTGRPRVLVSRAVPEIEAPAREILRGMGVYGFACTEFKRDARDGVYKLMEINGRPNLSTALSLRCGVNFPAIIHAHLTEGRVPRPGSWSTGIYWIDAATDVVQSGRHASRERIGIRGLLRPYVRRHVWADFDWDDPAPFFKRLAGVGAKQLA